MTTYVGIDPGMRHCAAAWLGCGGDGYIVDSFDSDERAVAPDGVVGIMSDVIRTDVLSLLLLDWISSVVRRSGPHYFGVEGPAFARNPSRSLQAGMVHKAVYTALFVASMRTNYPLIVVTIPPKTLKKYFTGNGNASKGLVRKALVNDLDVSGEYSQDILEAYASGRIVFDLVERYRHAYYMGVPSSVEAHLIKPGGVVEAYDFDSSGCAGVIAPG